MLTPCTRWLGSGLVVFATEGGIVVTFQEGQLSRQESFRKMTQRVKIDSNSREPRQGYYQGDLISQQFPLISAFTVTRKGVEIDGGPRGPGLTAASGGRARKPSRQTGLPLSSTLCYHSYFSTPVARGCETGVDLVICSKILFFFYMFETTNCNFE